MNYVTPYNNYVVINTNGDTIGYVDIEDCRDYVTGSELMNMLDYSRYNNEGYYDLYDEQDQKDFGTYEGVNKGECRIYDIDKLISEFRDSDILENEKYEIINELLKKDINLNIYDMGIDDIVSRVDAESNF